MDCKHIPTAQGRSEDWRCSKCGEPVVCKPSPRVSESDRRAIREFAAWWEMMHWWR